MFISKVDIQTLSQSCQPDLLSQECRLNDFFSNGWNQVTYRRLQTSFLPNIQKHLGERIRLIKGQKNTLNTRTQMASGCYGVYRHSSPLFQSQEGWTILPALGHHKIHLIPYKDKQTPSFILVPMDFL